MSAEKIIGDWRKKKFVPLYWLEGEEEYYIDQIMDYAEHHILNESESAFNLTIFYGRDTSWTDVLNACKRYPMFAERQVVLLKEAQHLKDIEKLESYIEHPLSSTILVVGYKGKGLDKRTKLQKLVKQQCECFVSEKVKDFKLIEWLSDYLKQRGLIMSDKGKRLLVDFIGNDLSRIANEIDKLLVNVGKRTAITEDDIEQNIGISKEYNAFELQAAIARKDLPKAITIIQYFEHNPKAGPIQMVLPALYGFFSRCYTAFGMNDRSEKGLYPLFFANSFAVREGLGAMKLYGFQGVEKSLLLLHEYNLKSIGIDDGGTSDASLMKELVVKMML